MARKKRDMWDAVPIVEIKGDQTFIPAKSLEQTDGGQKKPIINKTAFITYALFACIIFANLLIPKNPLMAFIIPVIALSLMMEFSKELLDAGQKVAHKAKMNPFLIGLILIPLLSSLHEQIITIMGNLANTDLGEALLAQQLGNKLFELLVSFGIAGVVLCRMGKCMKVESKERSITIRNGIFMSAGIILLAILIFSDNALSQLDSIPLLAFYGIFLAVTFILDKREGRKIEDPEFSSKDLSFLKEFGKLIFYLALIIISSQVIVEQFVYLNDNFDLFVKYSFIIFGMLIAMPNLIITIIGLRQGQTALVIGLEIGSAIWELSVSVSVQALVNPLSAISSNVILMLILMLIGAAIFVIFYIRTRWRLALWESMFLIGFYVFSIAIVIFFI